MDEIIEQNNQVEGEVSQEKKRELQEYEKIDHRLKEIEQIVTTDNLDMDESLKLYEEAVNLGLKASKTIENNVLVDMTDEREEQE